MTTREKFTKKMQALTTEQIIDSMVRTWNDEVGEIFREIGFEIIDERVSEEESDRIYFEVCAAVNA